MCIIFTSVTDRPDDETLIRAQRRNNDGIGLAWRGEDGLVHWEKGLKIEKLLDRLHNNPPPLPHVIHFRIATSGGALPELCHPFAVTPKASTALEGKAKAVLFHNGSWGGWQHEVKQAVIANRGAVPKGPWSDSRGLALMAGIYGPNIFNILEIASQRICYFSSDNFMTWGSWEKKDGWFASNPSFQNYAGAHKCGLNIESEDDWQKKPLKFDPVSKALVPMERRAAWGTTKGKGWVTVIKNGQIIPPVGQALLVDGGETSTLTRQVISKVIFQLRGYCLKQGYNI